MATTNAIRAVSEAIRTVLESARVGTPHATAAIQLARTEDFSTGLPTNGVTIHLYRVAIHSSMRSLPPRLSPDGQRFRPSFPLDLHYLLTPWAQSAGTQLELLGWMVRALEDNPTLPTALLNATGTVFREGEVVDVVAQPLTPVEMVAVWEFNKALMQPSMTYVARMVTLDSAITMGDATRIQTRGTIVEGVGG